MSRWVNIQEQGNPKESTACDIFLDGSVVHSAYFAGKNFYVKGRVIKAKGITHYRLPDNTPPDVKEFNVDRAFYYMGHEVKFREEVREPLDKLFKDMHGSRYMLLDLTRLDIDYLDYFGLAKQLSNIEDIEEAGLITSVLNKKEWLKKRREHVSNSK